MSTPQDFLTFESEFKLMKLNDQPWNIEPVAPDLRRSADAVSDGSNIFLRQAEQKHIYVFSVETCKQLQQPVECKYLRCSMVVYDGKLVTIGGAETKDKQSIRSNKLLTYSSTDQEWKECLPDMPIKRSRTTALTCPFGTGGHLIIVIGGEDERGNPLKRVDVLDTTESGNTWYRVQDLPEERICSSGAIVGGYVYILGGWKGIDRPTPTVLRCLLTDLMSTKQLLSETYNNNRELVWKDLPKLPVEEAACANINNKLLIIGGRANSIPTNEIRIFNSDQNRWEVHHHRLNKPRYICFAVGLSNKLIVIGGKKEEGTEDTLEVHNVV